MQTDKAKKAFFLSPIKTFRDIVVEDNLCFLKFDLKNKCQINDLSN